MDRPHRFTFANACRAIGQPILMPVRETHFASLKAATKDVAASARAVMNLMTGARHRYDVPKPPKSA